MNPNAWVLLTGYSVAIVCAALLGVTVQNAIRLTHTRMQVAMSFVAGFILGVALYHLVPHSLAQISGPRSIEIAAWWMTIGIILMLLLLRVFPFHHHDFGDSEDHHHDHHHDHGTPMRSLNWLGVSVGMGMHTLAEGAALGASVRSGLHLDPGTDLVSFGMFLAILFHKPLDSFSIIGLMRIAGVGRRTAIAVNVGIVLLCPLGAFLTYWGIGFLGPVEGDAIGRALAFAAGAIVCVALSDLLPEVHFHGHDRFLLTVSFLAGIALAYALHYLERLPIFGLAA